MLVVIVQEACQAAVPEQHAALARCPRMHPPEITDDEQATLDRLSKELITKILDGREPVATERPVVTVPSGTDVVMLTERVIAPMRGIAAAFGYTLDEARAWVATGLVDPRKGLAAVSAVALMQKELAAIGAGEFYTTEIEILGPGWKFGCEESPHAPLFEFGVYARVGMTDEDLAAAHIVGLA